jgi:hypothetical protein
MADLTLLMATETDFLTSKALGTFAGATGATLIVTNTARKLFNRELRVLPFFVALVFSYVSAQIVGKPDTFGDYALVFLNGCLLFLTAIGANDVVASTAQEGGINAQGSRQIRWLQSWYPTQD